MRIRNGFEEIFCWCSSLSIHWYMFRFVSTFRSENGCGKLHFWPETGSVFRDTGGTPPPRIPRSTPGLKGSIIVLNGQHKVFRLQLTTVLFFFNQITIPRTPITASCQRKKYTLTKMLLRELTKTTLFHF